MDPSIQWQDPNAYMGPPAGIASVPDYSQLADQFPQQQDGFQPQHQFQHPQLQEQQFPIQTESSAKKRRLGEDGTGQDDGFDLDDLPLVETGLDGWKPTKLLKVTDAIESLARDGKSLKYDAQKNTYTVVDGYLFEEEFNALRATRNKKNEAAKDRPFSRMHRFYTLLQGEKWAGTGSVFTPKSGLPPASIVPQKPAPSAPSPSTVSYSSSFSPVPEMNYVPAFNAPDLAGTPSTDPRSPSTEPGTSIVSAENVSVSIIGPSGNFEMISLQNFLDATGAGQLYARAVQQQQQQSGAFAEYAPQQPLSQAPAPGVPFSYSQQQLEAPLQVPDIYQVVGGVWSADSKGDQAYFFRRREGVMPVFNGAIVGILGGEVVKDDVFYAERAFGPEEGDEGDGEEVRQERGLWMVVSDKNAKWKGEPIPEPEEEVLGHWCCFLGQVPVCIDGKVKTGDHIGPKCDGSGLGRVVRPGRAQPVVGIALADKPSATPGIVKTLCFAGLNVLSEGKSEELTGLFDRMAATEARLAALEGKVKDVQGNVEDIELGVAGTRGDVENLAERVSLIEKLQFWRTSKPKTETSVSAEFANGANVAVGIPLAGAQPVQETGIKGLIRRHPVYFGALIGVIIALALTLGLVFAIGSGGSSEPTVVTTGNGTVVFVSSDSDTDT